MMARSQPASQRSEWPDIRGGMASLIRSHAWHTTPLGAIDGWPKSLKTAVELMLHMHQPASVLWHNDLITLYNDAYLPLLDDRHPAALGKSCAEMWPEKWDSLQPVLEAALAGEPQQLPSDRIWSIGGTDLENWYTWSWTPLRDDDGSIAGLFCSATEVALRISDLQLRTVLENALEGIFMQDVRSQRAAYLSPAMAEVTGFPLEDLYAMPEPEWLDRIHPADRKNAKEHFKKVASGIWGEGRAEMRWRAKDGNYRWLRISRKLVRDPMGAPRAVVGVCGDITRRKQTEEYLRKSEARLLELNEELIHVGRVSELSQVSAGIAHELNQPLAAMLNYTATAKRMIDNKDEASLASAQKCIAKAGEQAERAGEIIRRMRDFVEKRITRRAPEQINQIIKEALDLGLIGIKADGITFNCQCMEGLPPVLADRVQIQQVLVNLLRNAIDAMASATIRNLTVTTAPYDGGVEVSVADTGCGIPEHIRSKLFQPFVTTKSGGMGIGLAISRSIVEAHGGRITVEAPGSGGTVFRFTVPAATGVV
jgi:PAS domain S-box-containing protein